MEDYYSKADRIFEERKLKELFPEPEPIQTHPDLMYTLMEKRKVLIDFCEWCNKNNKYDFIYKSK
jgi:hypothetical protein